MKAQEIEIEFDQAKKRYEKLSISAKNIIETSILDDQIEILSVSSRVKDKTSALEKFERKSYKKLSQMTDICGIRIITYLNTQVKQISDIIAVLFDVDVKNSMDRSSILGSDRVGYRSVHFVCSLGSKRNKMKEYSNICGLKFEVQIRTVLQHAWAELTHDRSYKLGKKLPADIERKLNLHAGLLEITDTAFDEIAISVDEYSKRIEQESHNSFMKEEINSISLNKFITDFSKAHSIEIYSPSSDIISAENSLIQELKQFGVETIEELSSIFNQEFIDALSENKSKTTIFGVARSAMLYSDLENYFRKVKLNWQGLRTDTYNLLLKKYSDDHIRKVIKKYRIMLATSKTSRPQA